MQNKIKVNGWTFEYNKENEMYECRGEVMYDDEHDEMPEPELMQAAYILASMLEKDGYQAEADHSEKGWVEVHVKPQKQ